MYTDFEKKINYNFKDKNLLKQAFTHSSYAYEHKLETFKNNERFEFLGDAVLELVISDFLFKTYTKMSEGELTKFRASLVCEHSLAQKANEFAMSKYLLLGKGEEQMGGRSRDSILANTIEAVIGAVYLDNGLQSAQQFIYLLFMKNIVDNNFAGVDYKTYLQEHYQKSTRVPLKYETIEESGPDHNKKFKVRLSHKGIILGIGEGKNKKEAEQKAAFEAYKKLWKRLL